MREENNPFEVIAAHLRACEEALLDPTVRRDRARVHDLLTEDFQEFGASGLVWTRKEIFDLLASETYIPPSIQDFHCALIGEGVALVTYRAVRADAHTGLHIESLRSSIWTKIGDRWRLRFHQGTRSS